ncbi:MAG: hypothetical protein ACK4NS_05455 [Saprospiraceae bacterium]
MSFHQILASVHSWNRYLLLAALIFVLYRAYSGWLGRRDYTRTDNAASASLLGLTHLQLLLGLTLYFGTSAYTRQAFANMGAAMKDSALRYYAVEHITVMLLAVAMIQLGRTLSKKSVAHNDKFRKLAIYTSVGLGLIILSLAPKGLLF